MARESAGRNRKDRADSVGASSDAPFKLVQNQSWHPLQYS